MEKTIFDGLKIIRFHNRAVPSMTVGKSGIYFSSGTVKAMNKCRFIEILMNEKEKAIAIRESEQTSNALLFHDPNVCGRTYAVKYCRRDLSNAIRGLLTNYTDKQIDGGLHFDGVLHKEEKVIIFKLK